jgi:hypothetical protein
MVEIFTGLPTVHGVKSYLNMVDVFPDMLFAHCTVLKNETSLTLADVIEND